MDSSTSNQQESDYRILAVEVKHLREDTKETNRELRKVAASLHEVAINLTADRGRLNNIEGMHAKLEKSLSETKSTVSEHSKFIAIEKPKSANREKLLFFVLFIFVGYAVKTIFNI